MAANYTKVSNFTGYSPAQGYGLVEFPDGSNAVDNGAGGTKTDLTRDALYSTNMVFRVDLPNGSYRVTPTLGDSGGAARAAHVYFQDRWAGFVSTPSGGVTANIDYFVNVTAGSLRLRLVAVGGSGALAYICALSIVPLDFDFGTNTSPLAPGTTRVSNFTHYNDSYPQKGYGWTSLGPNANAVDRGTGTGRSALTQDAVYADAMTFKVDVPNGTYSAVITFGDHAAGSAHAAEVRLQDSSVPEQAILAPAKGAIAVKRYRVSVTDGSIRINLQGLGGGDRDGRVYLLGLSILPA